MTQLWTRTGGKTWRVIVGDVEAYEREQRRHVDFARLHAQATFAGLAGLNGYAAQETTEMQVLLCQHAAMDAQAQRALLPGSGSLLGGLLGACGL